MLFRKRQQVIICIVAGLLVADFVLFGYLPLKNRLEVIKQRRIASLQKRPHSENICPQLGSNCKDYRGQLRTLRYTCLRKSPLVSSCNR
jgi:hypothetical protein